MKPEKNPMEDLFREMFPERAAQIDAENKRRRIKYRLLGFVLLAAEGAILYFDWRIGICVFVITTVNNNLRNLSRPKQ